MTPIRLIPQPRDLQAGTGYCRMPMSTLRVHPDAAAMPALVAAARELGLRVRAHGGLPAWTAAIGPVSPPSAPRQAEGYAVSVSPEGVGLAGHDARGLVWSLGTLAQLRRAEGLPCCAIRDWPLYPIRYVSDDISRRQVSTVDDFRRIIRHLSTFKINHYTMYMEDLLQISGEPEIGCGRGALSAEEVRAIVAEGELRQVEVFPTVSLLGHQENLLRLPRYRDMGARTWQPPSSFDPVHPGLHAHLQKIIDAVCGLFPSRWFHMGFDETQGLDAEAFLAHANWCAERLVERGRTPLIWVDMLYNHFGTDLLARMHPAIVPVAWDYGRAGGKARVSIPGLLRHRRHAWTLGGLLANNTFLHDPLPVLQEQWTNWRHVADPDRAPAFGCSQWCSGYENLRDVAWPAYAAFAEQAWCGDGDPVTAEERFQSVFHGHPLPELTRLRRLLENGLSFTARKAAQLHLLPAPGWVRLARSGALPASVRLAADARRLAAARRALARCRRLATREQGHLEQYAVAIDRMASVVARAQAAWRPTRVRCAAAANAVAVARASFRVAWYACNRAEDIDHALDLCDRQIASWRDLPQPAPRLRPGWRPLDLGRSCNTCFPDVSGIPIGAAEIGGVPFRFANGDRTHAEIAPGRSLRIRLPQIPIRDLHLVISRPHQEGAPAAGARLRLSRGGRTVFSEELLADRHLCDWWAPLGDHMWAGGGFAYVDPMRVRWLLSPNRNFGLTCLHRFPWPAAPTADLLELTCLGRRPLQVFAVTIEEALR